MAGMRSSLLTVFLLIAISACSKAEDDRVRNQAIALGLRAFQVSDLRQGQKPFHVRARFKLLDTVPREVDGTYDLLWQSRTSWREQITFPGYQETRIGDSDHIFVRRPQLTVPSRLAMLRYIVDIGNTLGIGPNQHILKVKDSKFFGKTARCFGRDFSGKSTQTVCFDSSSGVLLGADASWGSKRVYDDFRVDGTKTVAHHIVQSENGKPTIEVWVEEVTFPEKTDSAQFHASGTDERFESCSGFEVRARAVKNDPPPLPQEVRGNVNAWVVVDKQGTVERVAIEDAIPEQYRDIIISTLKSWKYQPAKCGSTAIPSEFAVTLDVTRYLPPIFPN